jgi:AraC family transcriptional regulator
MFCAAATPSVVSAEAAPVLAAGEPRRGVRTEASSHVAARTYAERICKVMDLDAPPTVVAQPLRKSMVAFSRVTSARPYHGILQAPIEDAFALVLSLGGNPSLNVWFDGCHHVKRASGADSVTLIDFNVETVIEMKHSFDMIQIYFPRSALNTISAEQRTHEVSAFDLDLLRPTDDIVVKSLGHCLLPAFERPEQANRLFVDHIATAVLTHTMQAYGDMVPLLACGGLATWQLRRAKEMLMAHLDGEITLEALAGECELSRSHFARAFKKTTGCAPHRWLMQQRVERARDLLLGSELPLAEIADQCGFSDQSHFSRVFAGVLGIPPGEWRRMRRS